MSDSSGRAGGHASDRVRVLLVDDDALVRRAIERALRAGGYEVAACPSAAEALRRLDQEAFDVVISDIGMPDLDGVELLRRVRSHDRDLPVVFVTGDASNESATAAMNLGASAYLVKPIEMSVLREQVARSARAHRTARTQRLLRGETGGAAEAEQLDELRARFERALGGLYLVYQPIVRWSERRVIGYEALMRSREPSLCMPLAILDVAERLGRIPDVGRRVRELAADAVAALPPGADLFANVHAHELADEALADPSAPLSRHAGRVVLELTERAYPGTASEAVARLARLRALGYRVAIDDLGAGHSGLARFVDVQPDLVKVDMSLVRDVDFVDVKRRLVGSMLEMCGDLSIPVVCEGVETGGERDALAAMGAVLMQGYHFARPAPELAIPALPAA